MVAVAGVDGAKEGGWVVVRLLDGHLDRMAFAADFGAVLAETKECSLVLIDVPIGHEDPAGTHGGRRAADVAAREYLGGERAGTVFFAPPTSVLRVETYEAACEAAAAACGWRPSKQLWMIRDRILRAEALAVKEGDRVREGHPEVSFQAMLRETAPDGHLAYGKKGWHGLHERLELLLARNLRPQRLLGGIGLVTPDDVLDATALAWSAQRVAEGRGASLPSAPPVDPALGRPVAIWY